MMSVVCHVTMMQRPGDDVRERSQREGNGVGERKQGDEYSSSPVMS
jgi:hypothetical protein